ncbi:MAG TPA: LexA family transcriptional repressor [Oceanospirillales bacterium]|jgi:phage repressor protein C with HTH and peptisase S24 domain|nr:LexA family transcriptional repressor [Oleispira sp.]HCM04946.1 LexA family transcriptional repressor [Oceanospirillales bacterium]|tara:strand:+ start:59 stop:718 length:660 start_codon:yes stop_codon:yes gene_type:complete
MSTAFSRRFQLVVDQLAQGNKKHFAELTGKSASHIYKICRGISRPSMAYLQELYEEYKVDLTWLLTGEQSAGNQVAGTPSNQDLIFAPMFDVQASAGLGNEVVAEDVEDYFAFNKSFLSRQLNVSSEQLVFVTISGDSMLPTLHDGDRVLVDMSQKAVSHEGLYLLQSEDGLMAKRLSDKQGELSVVSDNPEYDNWKILPANREANPVAGKIVWCARTI